MICAFASVVELQDQIKPWFRAFAIALAAAKAVVFGILVSFYVLGHREIPLDNESERSSLITDRNKSRNYGSSEDQQSVSDSKNVQEVGAGWLDHFYGLRALLRSVW